MSDTDVRTLERRWHATGTRESAQTWLRALARVRGFYPPAVYVPSETFTGEIVGGAVWSMALTDQELVSLLDGSWHHFCGIELSSTDSFVSLDGVNIDWAAENATSDEVTWGVEFERP